MPKVRCALFGSAAAGPCGFLRPLRFKLPVRARKRWSNAETKTVIAAYERCLASGDMDGLAVLRQAIEVSALAEHNGVCNTESSAPMRHIVSLVFVMLPLPTPDSIVVHVSMVQFLCRVALMSSNRFILPIWMTNGAYFLTNSE